MKKFLLFPFLFAFGILFGQSAFPVRMIVDTDGAADDLRAITLLLASQKCDILAFICTDGTLNPAETADKIGQLLCSLDLDRLLYINPKRLINPPAFRAKAKQFQWGNCNTLKPVPSIDSLQVKNNQSFIYIVLGPLTSLNQLLKQKEFKKNLDKVIWYNDYPANKGFNYKADSVSARQVFSSGIQIEMISNLDKPLATFDEDLLYQLKKLNNSFTHLLTNTFETPPALYAMKQGHLRLWDDLVPIYIFFPSLFMMEQYPDHPQLIYTKDFIEKGIRYAFLQMLQGNLTEERNIAFYSFPSLPQNYQYDIGSIADTAIKLYGAEEWKMCILTNEFHEHVGIYSIIGVKMGMFARDYFNASIDQLTVISDAGSQPPLSCLNDGLQSSTGSTLGRGTISLGDKTTSEASATFEFKGKKIRLTLKPQYKNQATQDIEKGIVNYGNLTQGYWKLIRQLSIRYWVEWDRKQIFLLEELNP